jgi:hypothetical protein
MTQWLQSFLLWLGLFSHEQDSSFKLRHTGSKDTPGEVRASNSTVCSATTARHVCVLMTDSWKKGVVAVVGPKNEPRQASSARQLTPILRSQRTRLLVTKMQ